jgi:hypothetical protein
MKILTLQIAGAFLAAVSFLPCAHAQDKAKQDASSTQPADNSGKPMLIVHDATVAKGVAWPYDVHAVKANIVASLQLKDGDKFDVVPNAPSGTGHGYVLEEEITQWHPGNAAVRGLVGYGAGREVAVVHYWVTDPQGEKVFEHTDTIRSAFFSSVSSVGDLLHPLGDKIAARIQHANLLH